MKQFIQYTDKVCGNRWFPLTFILFAFFVVLFFSTTTSLLYEIEHWDSAVFKMMGHVILQGGIPYVDFFDHKGPILYFINALGEFISPVWGLFALQVIVNSLAMILWFYIAKLFIRPTYSFIATLLAIFFYIGVHEYGNLTEEWSILPSSLALYLSISYLVKHHDKPHPYWCSLIYGLCFGTMFFIRPNDAVMIVGGIMTGIFLYLIFKRKEYKKAILNALVFLGGFTIIATPIIIYFAYHNAIKDLYLGLLGFNMKYNNDILWNFLSYRFTLPLFALCAITIIMTISIKKHNNILWIVIPPTILVLLFLGRSGFPHYYMTLIPIFFLCPIILLFLQKNRVIVLLCTILLLMLPNRYGGNGGDTIIYSELGYSTIKNRCQYLVKWKYKQPLDLLETDKLFSHIPETEKDSIWNYNDTYTRRFCHAHFKEQNPLPPVIAVQQKNLTEQQILQTDISIHKPLWLFFVDNSSLPFEPTYILPTDSAFIHDNYEIAYRTDSTICNCYLLKRKY